MKVDLENHNEALFTLIDNFSQILPLDANLLIPSDRSKVTPNASLDFNFYKRIWLDPFFKTFPYLAIHQAVYEEVVTTPNLSNYIKQKIQQQVLILLKDDDLTCEEHLLRNGVEQKIAASTNYEPEIDNRDDRGEVKSLAHIHVKELIYFCSHDSNALRLVDKAVTLETSLESLITIKLYEIIYYLSKLQMADSKEMRFLYKFHYYLTSHEKKTNPSWNDFRMGMDRLYDYAVKNSRGKPTPLL
ncbi:hypothetical protein [Lentibacillus salicampi]|uniref:Uncharacterized protein n=1 Tax=Lentibacillus salicampi TaxID=175306 RepID=A0A4Y9AEP4_9BACI|nr:hypothetical protein [Lentibacillus salicampi]TFJ93430.1 hypothetical protein E4U82_07120 [Lentibacillus salicampi]